MFVFSCSQKSYKQQTSNDRNRWCRLLIMRISDIIPSLFFQYLLDDSCNCNHTVFISTLERLLWFLLPSIRKIWDFFMHTKDLFLFKFYCVLKKSLESFTSTWEQNGSKNKSLHWQSNKRFYFLPARHFSAWTGKPPSPLPVSSGWPPLPGFREKRGDWRWTKAVQGGRTRAQVQFKHYQSLRCSWWIFWFTATCSEFFSSSSEIASSSSPSLPCSWEQ